MKFTKIGSDIIRKGRDQIEAELKQLPPGGLSKHGHDELKLREMLDCLERELTRRRKTLH